MNTVIAGYHLPFIQKGVWESELYKTEFYDKEAFSATMYKLVCLSFAREPAKGKEDHREHRRVKTEQGISVKTWTKLQVGLNVNFSFKTLLSVCL